MEKISIIEGYPDYIKVRMEKRDEKRNYLLPELLNGHSLELVIEDLLLWSNGPVSVSFRGGDAVLHKKIAQVAATWSQFANISFDFGYHPDLQTYREWVPGDSSHIRVGFADSGYWSLVGMDSQDPDLILPGEITLNLEKFDVQLPSDWKTIVLHEFGHALGFHHEHQSPVSDCDFDWETVYAELGGPPNNWSKEKVDFNLRKMPAGGLTYSPHDKYSIMHYAFPEWMFLTGKASPCYVSEPGGLSKEDREMAAVAYPFNKNEIIRLKEAKKQNLEILLKEDLLKESFKEASANSLEQYFPFWKNQLDLLNSGINQDLQDSINFNNKAGRQENILAEKSKVNLESEVKIEILLSAGQAGEDPAKLGNDMMLENLLPSSFAYQFLADSLDSLVKLHQPQANVELSDVQNCDTVGDCVSMINGKV
jgi:hypothetical protein